MTTPRPTTSPRPTDRLGLPPPLALDLSDTERRVGAVREDVIVFRGFGSAVEAAHAAWVAHRALARKLAPREHRRPIPVDSARLALDRRADVERVLANGRPIATLRRPAAHGARGDETFGFELRVPGPADELTVRSLAYVAYRALRKSGVRWAMWARDARRARRDGAVPSRVAHAAGATSTSHATTATAPASSRWPRRIHLGVAFLGLVSILVAALAVPTAAGVLIAMTTLGALTAVGILAFLPTWWVRTERPPVRPRARRVRMDGTRAAVASPAPVTGRRARARRRARAAALATIASLALLVLAFAAPEALALPMSLVGITGLLAIRLFAMPADWPPRRPVRVHPLATHGAPTRIPEVVERETVSRERTPDAARVARHGADDDRPRDPTGRPSPRSPQASARRPPLVAHGA